MEVIKKIAQIGGLEMHVISPGDIRGVQKIIENSRAGIVLMSENALINTRRIDAFLEGKVEPEAVDLKSMKGNPQVVNIIRIMLKNSKTAYFLGTAMQDFGGYFLPVMPVVIDGKLDLRVKITANEYVDSYPELARRLFDEDYAEKVRNFSGFFCEQPMKKLVERLREESKKLKLIKSYTVGDLRVLPIICNEILTLPDSYEGAPVDLLLHSADSLYVSAEQRSQEYERLFFRMKKKDKLSEGAVLAYAQAGTTPSAGMICFNGKTLNQII